MTSPLSLISSVVHVVLGEPRVEAPKSNPEKSLPGLTGIPDPVPHPQRSPEESARLFSNSSPLSKIKITPHDMIVGSETVGGVFLGAAAVLAVASLGSAAFPVALVGLLVLAACGGEISPVPPPTYSTTPPASPTNPDCEELKKTLENPTSPDEALKTLVDAIAFDGIDQKIEFQTDSLGESVVSNSQGGLISSYTPTHEDILTYQKAGNFVFLLMKHKIGEGLFGPPLLLVYQSDPEQNDKLIPVLVANSPTLNHGNSNAILIPNFFDPQGMGLRNNDSELAILVEDKIITLDPVGLKIISGDWCESNKPSGT